MIYLDANLFIYALLDPKKRILSKKTTWMKSEAKRILKEIYTFQNNEIEYVISVVQLSEIVNVLKSRMTWDELHKFLMSIYGNKSIEIIDVSALTYLTAIDKIVELKLDSNDIIAYLIMKERNITKIYTFDEGFQSLKDIECVPKIPESLV